MPVEFDERKLPDYPGMARWYCEELVQGRVPACGWERKGAERFLKMLTQAEKPRSEFMFSPDHVADVCEFLEKLPHVKGFEGEILLEPVQCWWLAAIFGFRDKDSGRRWVRQASIYLPRKNGKSLISAGLALFCANCEGEIGAEVVISAGSEDQANRVYGPIREMLRKEPDLALMYGAKPPTGSAKKVQFENTGGSIEPVATLARNLDGYNPHLVIAEELHAQKQEIVGVLTTSQGSRKMPLFLSISTAGRLAEGPAWEDWKQCQAVLNGRMAAPRMFVAMYGPDQGDETRYFDTELVEKLNPLYGTSLNETALEKEQRDARKSEADLNEYKRTRLNVWSRAAGNLIAIDAWDRCADPALDLGSLKGFPLFAGLDLASRQDLNAAQFMVEVGDRVYTVGKYWLGRNCPRLKDDRFADAFLGWHRDGWLELTDLHDGTFVDYKAILKLFLEMIAGHNVVGVALDDFQANMMASDIEMAGYQTFIVRKNARALTPATEDLIARVNNPSTFQHDGNPITTWCAGNVVGHWDANANVLPKKAANDSKANIDGIDALILANAIRIDHRNGVLGVPDKERDKPNPYLSRGLAGFSA